MIFRGAPTHILPLAELNISPMTTLVDVQTPKTPIAPRGVRSSLWGMMLVVAGSASGAFFGDTVLGAALGLVASSAVTSYLNHNEKNSSRVWIVVAMVSAVWMLAASIIAQK